MELVDLKCSSLHDLFNTRLTSLCPENGFSPVWGKLMVPQNSFCHELIVAGVTDPENYIYRAD